MGVVFSYKNGKKRASSQSKTSWTMESPLHLNHSKTNLRSNVISLVIYRLFRQFPNIYHIKAKSLDRRESLTTDKTTFPLTPSLNIDLCKMKCKDYYWLYINGTTCTAKRPKMGKRTKITEY